MRYAIKKIWNDAEHRAALDAIVPQGYRVAKRRGRGFRRGHQSLGYAQSLPLDYAAYFTMYIEPCGYQFEGMWRIHQLTFRGFRNGKPVLRFERADHVAKPH